jgi:hypothetical protein
MGWGSSPHGFMQISAWSAVQSAPVAAVPWLQVHMHDWSTVQFDATHPVTPANMATSTVVSPHPALVHASFAIDIVNVRSPSPS